MGIGYDDDTSSLSLPPLMDSYITFDQPSISKGQQYEQVPCFSNIFTPNYQTNPTFSDITHMEDPIKLPTPPTFTFVGMPEISTFSCEKSVIKSVLNHLTKKGSPSLGKGMMPESFLSDVMWNQYWFWAAVLLLWLNFGIDWVFQLGVFGNVSMLISSFGRLCCGSSVYFVKCMPNRRPFVE